MKTRSQFSGKVSTFPGIPPRLPTKQTQKQGAIAIIKETLKRSGVTGLYSGCTALILGNSVKAGVRFVSYDHFKHMLADPQVSLMIVLLKQWLEYSFVCGNEGKVSAPRSLLGVYQVLVQRASTLMLLLVAGLGAGMMEAIFAVTPSETIKCALRRILFPLTNSFSRTKLIDDAKGPNPQYRGLIHGTTQIVKQEGIRGIYRGLFPVVGILTYMTWTMDSNNFVRR